MARPSSLKNLGPQSDRMLHECGIETAEDVRQLGSAMTYKILSHRFGSHVNRIWLFALEGALTDRHWNSFSPEEKAKLIAATEDELVIGGRS